MNSTKLEDWRNAKKTNFGEMYSKNKMVDINIRELTLYYWKIYHTLSLQLVSLIIYAFFSTSFKGKIWIRRNKTQLVKRYFIDEIWSLSLCYIHECNLSNLRGRKETIITNKLRRELMINPQFCILRTHCVRSGRTCIWVGVTSIKIFLMSINLKFLSKREWKIKMETYRRRSPSLISTKS